MASDRLSLVVAFVLIIVILVPVLMLPAKAAPVTVTVSTDSVSINMNFDLVENLTTSLPLLDIVQDQSSPILQPIQSGFRSIAPDARIDFFTLQARTAEINNRTGLWSFQENYTIRMTGVNSNIGGRVIADLAFLSSKNNQSIFVSGVELNNIGQSYLVQGFSRFPPDSKTRYFAGTGGFTLPLVPEQFTSSFSLLDLTWIKPVSTWSGGYQYFQSSSIWDLHPRVAPFNVTVAQGLTTENTFQKEYVAALSSSVEIIAPPRAQASGTAILFDLPTTAETIMPALIATSLATLIATLLLERRVFKSTRPYKARKH